MSSALNRRDRYFHETWLGNVQPVEGLVLSVPILVEAQCAASQPALTQHSYREHVTGLPQTKAGKTEQVEDKRPPAISSLRRFLKGFLGWEDQILLGPAELPDSLKLWVPEGRQELKPTFALRNPHYIESDERPADQGPAADTSASLAGVDLTLLVWKVERGLPLDKAETMTGEWHYPPARKFERLLRHCRVPLGLISNGEELRLMYAPHGESLGSITFRVGDMAQSLGKSILDAFLMLLSADNLFSDPTRGLPELCRQSRARQADVTEELAKQVFDALVILLEGFEAAATRATYKDRKVLEEALLAEGNHLYGGLLAVLLRLVFVLYAEDNGILPIDDPVYQQHLSILGLFAQLQEDAGAYPDSMDRRFGAWPRLLALFRAVHRGLSHGTLHMPPRRGRLFEPDSYPFLEGRGLAGAAEVGAEANSRIQTPRIDDATIHQVLESLLVLEGQRLSYRSLDVEQIGSVYERLMGFRVERLQGEAVCIKAGDTGAWVSAEVASDVPANRRGKWFQEEWGVVKAQASKLAKGISGAKTQEEVLGVLETQRFSIKGRTSNRRVEGRLVLQPGKERIRTSSHYTPRTLSQPIVQRTLDPIIRALGENPTAEQLLSLKICDPAMGSGAFLVEACRFLADHVVSAWAHHGELEEMGTQVDEPTVHARRLVAQRCLYGVDKNRFAVDLARMSLWLVTLARDEPFTFVDHALRHGDSLMGLTVEAIRRFDWDLERSATMDAFADELDRAVVDALAKREQILELAGEEGAGLARTKELLLGEAEAAMRLPRLVGDVLVGAWFSAEKEKDRDVARRERLGVLTEWLNSEQPQPRTPAQLQAWAAEIRDRAPVFHWSLEFPEIFHLQRPDPLDDDVINHEAMMDAFLGNPPFAGKNAITANNGEGYIKWLQMVHPESHGNADLSAHFFRRADKLLGPHGTIGLIATNTIGQGDSRSTGLQYLLRDSRYEIYHATNSMPWPGKAAVTIDVVHLATGTPTENVGTPVLDDVSVESINSRLRPKPERPDPVKLRENAGKSFVGTYVLGMGFTLTPEERAEFVANAPRNEQRIFPYLGGQELNSTPEQCHSRYVISFGELTLDDAEQWPDLIHRVRELVKPERDKNNREQYRKYWWHFGEKRPALYHALEPLARCLACARVSKHLILAWQPTDRIFSEQLCVFPLDRDAHFALLQSRVHERWARLLSSSMKTDLRYSASDCFETYPFPPNGPLKVGSDLDEAGKTLKNARAAYCLAANSGKGQGLTGTYNDLKNPETDGPDVARLRELHLAVDRAVVEAYGWSSVPVPKHLFPRPDSDDALETIPLIDAIPPFTTPMTEEEKREHQRFEDAVIDQLFALNAKRAAEEARQATATTRKATTSSRKRSRKPTAQGEIDI